MTDKRALILHKVIFGREHRNSLFPGASMDTHATIENYFYAYRSQIYLLQGGEPSVLCAICQ
jgi:UDP-N-acetylmuramyl tripeptide synthase